MRDTLKFKAISSLEKCFYDDDAEKFPMLTEISLLKNEKLSFQLLIKETDDNIEKYLAFLKIDGKLKDYISVKQTVCVPSAKPTAGKRYDDNYLRTTSGLYPDLITDLGYQGKIAVPGNNLRTLWLDIELPEGIEPDDYNMKFSLIGSQSQAELAFCELNISVVDFSLPDCEIPHTEWFYTDCIADYYDIEVFSEKHWEYIENFARTACENGINTLLTPVITPALDTYIGGERTTTQLVGIKLNGGKYSFDFSKLDRWIDMCQRVGIKYLEIPPFYTQWGAKAAPKIIAEVDGTETKIFGWDTDSLGTEYSEFLDAFIPSLVDHLKLRGVDHLTFYHISDEPTLEQFEHYNATAEHIKKHLSSYTIIDAVSHIEVFERGILDTPVVVASAMQSFIDAGAKKAWMYYCCGPEKVFTNRFISMPSARTRILGVQMYKLDIKGFLHWGFNFYNCQYSYNTVNPYLDTTGDYFASSGDAFLVYPGRHGVPEASIRLIQMRDAFQDLRALKLAEELYGRERIIEIIDEGLEKPLTLSEYPRDAEYILKLRKKINALINSGK